jgi:hypothetical protein
MELGDSSEILVPIYQITRRHIPQDSTYKTLFLFSS